MQMIPTHYRDTVAVTDIGAYKRNLKKINAYTGSDVRLMAVVKCNAYGHGMIECARASLEAGATMLGVAIASEGEKLRNAGFTVPILVFSSEPRDHLNALIEHDLTLTLTSLDMLEDLREVLEQNKSTCTVHINVDTGMGRVGCKPDEAIELVHRAGDVPGMTVEGIYTHFPSADEDRDNDSREQIGRFRKLIDALSKRKIRPPIAHMCNSAGTLKFPEAHFDMVRTGIMTYGLIPYEGSSEVMELEPVLSFISRIGFIKEVPAGTEISYGGTYTTKRRSVLATVAVGYGDGYNRHLSNKGRALINGIPVPVVGRVCMDQTVFDVTDAGAVHIGDAVTLIGRDGDERITVEDHAEIAGTISHEIVTGITGRVSRAYIETT